MSWVRVWIHMVFCTKYNRPLLPTEEIRKAMWVHIKENAAEKRIFLEIVNGYTNHAHCLISLGREQTISQVAQLIKGESSHWINKNGLLKKHFNWQDDYWAVSISESHMQRVRNYIYSQEAHHGKKNFENEIEDLETKHGLKRIKD